MAAKRRDPERRGTDRRRRPTRVWDVLLTPGRRHRHRREADVDRSPVLDWHGTRLFLLVMALLVLTLVDGGLTLALIDTHHDEANPVMARLLERGAEWFLIGKYMLTAACVPWLIVWKDHRLFGTRVRVKYLFPALVGLYVVLTGFQVWALVEPQGPARWIVAVREVWSGLIGRGASA